MITIRAPIAGGNWNQPCHQKRIRHLVVGWVQWGDFDANPDSYFGVGWRLTA